MDRFDTKVLMTKFRTKFDTIIANQAVINNTIVFNLKAI